MRLIIILTSLIIHWKAAVIIGAAGRINLLVNVRAQFMTSIIKRRKSSGTAVSSRSTIGLFVFEFDCDQKVQALSSTESCMLIAEDLYLKLLGNNLSGITLTPNQCVVEHGWTIFAPQVSA